MVSSASNAKIHAIVSCSSLVVALSLSAGNLRDAPQGRTLVRSLTGRSSEASLLMDKVYEGDRTRNCGVDCGMIRVAPPKRNRLEPWDYDKELYKQRNEAGVFSKVEAFSTR